MSGGYFDYDQYRLGYMADDIEQELINQGKQKPAGELWGDDEYYEKYPEDKYFETYPDLVQTKLKETVNALRIAQIYTHRADWFLSADDGDESFVERLADDLEDFKKSKKYLK